MVFSIFYELSSFSRGGFLFTNEGGFLIFVLATSSTREFFLVNAGYLGQGNGRQARIEYIFLFSLFLQKYRQKCRHCFL